MLAQQRLGDERAVDNECFQLEVNFAFVSKTGLVAEEIPVNLIHGRDDTTVMTEQPMDDFSYL